MSEFHRMVTYLYLYEGSLKTRNVGYAKIEKKDAQCRIEIHMKNTGLMEHDIPVYFYTQKNDRLPGISLGSMNFVRGTGEFREVFDTVDISGSGYGISAIKGIFCPVTDQKMILSQWDDDVFDRNAFFPVEDSSGEPSSLNGVVSSGEPFSSNGVVSSRQPSPSNGGVSSRQPSPSNGIASSGEPSSSNGIVSPGDTLSSNGIVSSRELPPSNGGVSSGEPLPSNEVENSFMGNTVSHTTTTDLKAAEAAPALSTETPAPDSASISNAKTLESHSSRWKFIMENFPQIHPFPSEDSFEWVQLELKDLRLFPKSYWYLGNNSFLLHGFFNYQHLILGRKKETENCQWTLGIPGVFQNPERVMAAIFGFPEFHSTSESNINTGQFGYWLRPLD